MTLIKYFNFYLLNRTEEKLRIRGENFEVATFFIIFFILKLLNSLNNKKKKTKFLFSQNQYYFHSKVCFHEK